LRRHLIRLLAPAGLLIAMVGTSVAVAAYDDTPSRAGERTGNGRKLDPAGRMTRVGTFPTGGAVTPDGRFYWAVDGGRHTAYVHIVNLKNGKEHQRLPIPGGDNGIAFSPDGRHAYVSGLEAEDPAQQELPGAGGDVVHAYTVNTRSGLATENKPIALPNGRDGAAAADGLPPSLGVKDWPEGLAITPDGKTLLVVLGQADQLAIIDLASGNTHLADVGRYPYAVAADPHRARAYVSSERDGSVSVIELPSGRTISRIAVGGGRGAPYAHAEGLAIDPVRDRLYVAVTDRDLLAVIDTHTLKAERFVDVGRPPLPIGVAPVSIAVSPDGRTAYVADAGEDTVTAVGLVARARHKGYHSRKAFTVIGRIPTAAYTTDVSVTPDGKRLIWLSARGLGTGPNGQKQNIDTLLEGRAGVLTRPTDRGLAALTARADKALIPTNRTDPPIGTVVRPDGPIKHVFYVVKENRTYDQILGDDARGHGDPRLLMFGDNNTPPPTGGVTPNVHELVREFPLLDSVYANSEESTEGHKVTSSAYANNYTQRKVASGRGRKGDPDIFPIGVPPNAAIFDQAVRQGVSFRVFGEFGGGNNPFADDTRPTYLPVQLNTDPAYPSQVQGTCLAVPLPNPLRCSADAAPFVSTRAGHSTSGAIAAQSRMGIFQDQFLAQSAVGAVPTFTYMILFNNHTNGTTPGFYTPKANVADNDLAVGQLVDLVSHSPIWDSSAIFVLEDDSQDGADHVDAHRIPALAISPYTRRGAVIHSRFDQLSFLRTAEILVGLKPRHLAEALAVPLFGAFTGQPSNAEAYSALTPQVDMTARNTGASPNAKLSQRLPLNGPDRISQRELDRLLWQDVHGVHAQPPPSGPNASAEDDEGEHGAEVPLPRLRRHR
jgi:DNA-binding beta-propeller fold protein YncE